MPRYQAACYPTKYSLRPLQNPHLRRIFALCAARSFAYLYDMSAFAVLLRLELHPHPNRYNKKPSEKFSDGFLL
ncbi:signal peptidase [Neisseria dumasiana]|nr:signal peptidase [Neisseria dumasiana]UOO84986.1 signal peptidase [Neisseria dumasiana]